MILSFWWWQFLKDFFYFLIECIFHLQIKLCSLLDFELRRTFHQLQGEVEQKEQTWSFIHRWWLRYGLVSTSAQSILCCFWLWESKFQLDPVGGSTVARSSGAAGGKVGHQSLKIIVILKQKQKRDKYSKLHSITVINKSKAHIRNIKHHFEGWKPKVTMSKIVVLRKTSFKVWTAG